MFNSPILRMNFIRKQCGEVEGGAELARFEADQNCFATTGGRLQALLNELIKKTAAAYKALCGARTDQERITFPREFIKRSDTSKVPDAQGMQVCGSKEGWLIMVRTESADVFLFNKTTKEEIQLPSINCSLSKSAETQKKSCAVHKAVLSSAPDCTKYDYIVMIIYGESKQLAFYKAGYETWVLLQGSGSSYDDIISLEGGIYAVDEYGKVVLFEFDIGTAVAARVLVRPWFFWGNKVYLVVLEDELCIVIRYLQDHPDSGTQETYSLKVCRLDYYRKVGYTIEDIGNWVIFLGQNHSAALPADHCIGVCPNCICFKDDYANLGKGSSNLGSQDMLVFDLQDCRIETLPWTGVLQNIWEDQIVG